MQRLVWALLAASLAVNAAWLAQWVHVSRRQYAERDVHAGIALVFDRAPVVEAVTTPFQHVEVRKSDFFGKVLVIDDDLMLTERDEFSYHEMAAHVPLAYLPDAQTVVIIGGGDGGVCSQVLQHRNVARVVMVEIDPQVVDVAQRHFPQFKRCFEDERVELVLRDGAAWAREAAAAAADSALRSAVDVVIVDSTDFNQAETLFTVRFYRNIAALLSARGVVVLNLSSMSWNLPGCAHAVRRQRRVFDIVVPYQVFQPTYMSGHYGYLFCSNAVNPVTAAVDWAAMRAKAIPTRYYSPSVHWAAFALPPFVMSALPPFYAPQVRSSSPTPFPTHFPLLSGDAHFPGEPGSLPHLPPAAHRLGVHVLAEFMDTPYHILNDQPALLAALRRAAEHANLTVVDSSFHAFSPHGVTGVLILAESHFTIHTWPERGYAAVDVFACAPADGAMSRADPHAAVEHLAKELKAGRTVLRTTHRGAVL